MNDPTTTTPNDRVDFIAVALLQRTYHLVTFHPGYERAIPAGDSGRSWPVFELAMSVTAAGDRQTFLCPTLIERHSRETTESCQSPKQFSHLTKEPDFGVFMTCPPDLIQSGCESQG
jgi:hypothetical protein